VELGAAVNDPRSVERFSAHKGIDLERNLRLGGKLAEKDNKILNRVQEVNG